MEHWLRRRRGGGATGAPRILLRKEMETVRSAQQVARRMRVLIAFLVFFVLARIAVAGFVFCARFLLLNANRLGRQCNSSGAGFQGGGLSFGIVSCSDDLSTVPHRSFQGMMELVSPNKRSYAARHGYTYIDASDVLDVKRPPSWSKIKAVHKFLGSYDWIFWNDADSLVTNSAITLEDVLKSTLGDLRYEDMPDLIITQDVSGVNAGMFFIRNSTWSRQFLDRWWNQTSFIKPFGESKSGDNDALKFLIKSMPTEERHRHIHIPRMQCLFNSYIWTPSWKNVYRLFIRTKTVWKGTYSTGDFMVHLAGVDNKKRWIHEFLRKAKSGTSQLEWLNLWTMT